MTASVAFEEADGGTIFLDEIGDLSPFIQVKLLRVLQEREIERVGESRRRPVNIRVITATNVDLPMLVREGAVPRGPLLPAQGFSHPPAEPARTAGGYTPAHQPFCRPPERSDR